MTDEDKIKAEIERLLSELIVNNEGTMFEQGRISAFEDMKLFINSLPEEPKECMYSKGNYTDEDRKILCDGCEEDCKYNKKEPVAPKDMLNAKTAAESLGISQEEHDRIVDKLIYGKEPELVDADDLPKEEPVSNDFEMALAEMIDKAQKCVVEPWVLAAQWKDELIKLAKSEEPVSEDLEEAARNIRDRLYLEEGKRDEFGNPYFLQNTILKAVIMGAQWQKEQFEKNRIKHCNSITNEQAELEQGFIDQHLDKYQRMPTYLDAIEYGMNLQKEQLMASGTDVTVHIDAGGYPYIPKIELYDYDKDIPLAKEGDKYKVILIKED